MKAKKSLGQHFLKSDKALSQIVDAAHPTGDDLILEIGPGQGVLTERLIPFAGKVIAVEKDRELIPVLEERFTGSIASDKLDVVEADILQFNPEELRSYKGFDYKIVANIPYYITGAIIEKFLSATYQPSRMVLLMQKEVAERIVARDNKGSVLSIAVKAYGVPTLVAKVPAGAFNPPPKVDSAILLVDRISREYFADVDEGVFFALLKNIFGKKRKQLLGSLAEYLHDRAHALYIVSSLGLDPKIRPEDLTLADWKRLAQAVSEKTVVQ